MAIILIIGEEDKGILTIYLDNEYVKASVISPAFFIMKGEYIMYLCRNPTLIWRKSFFKLEKEGKDD